MIVFTVIGGLVLVALGVAAYVGTRPNRELLALAETRQWQVTEADQELPGTFGGRPFASGYDRVASVVARGRHNGRAILVVDYAFRIRAGDGGERRRYWAACVDDLPAALPALEVMPRMERADRHAGPGIMADAKEFLTADPDFDKQYRVTALDHELAAAVLDAKVLRLLAKWPGFSWRIEGNRLLTWGQGAAWPQDVEPALTKLVTLAAAIPDGVWPQPQG